MATVIDELVTILGLDMAPGVLPKIQKFNTMIDGVTRYVGWASAALMAAATSITYFTERMAQTSAKMANFSQLTGINSSRFQELGFAAEMAGGSFDALQSDLMGLTKSMTSPIPGEFNHALFMMGVSAYDAAGKMKTADQVLLDVADKMEGMSKQHQIQWASRIGISDDTLLMLQMGRKEIGRLQQQARDIPTIVGEQQLKDAKEFVIQLGMVRRIMTYIGQEATSAAGPALKMIVGDFTKWLTLNREFIQSSLKNTVDGIVDGFQRFSTLLRKISERMGEVAPWTKKLVESLTSVNVISAVVLGALVALAGVIVVLGAKWALITAAIMAAGLAIDDVLTYFEGGNSVLGEMIDLVKDLWKQFSEKFPGISKYVESFIRIFKSLGKIIVDDLVAGFKLAWEGLKIFGDKISWAVGLITPLIDKFLQLTGLSDMAEKTADLVEGFAADNEVVLKGFVNRAVEYNARPTAPTSSNNTINITQNISGDNAVGVASESSRKINTALQQTFPGGLAPVVN